MLLGALAAGVAAGPELACLERFGAEVGLAFQIQDDILDVEGDPALLGKSTGADAAHGKPTYPSTAGLAAARRRADELRDSAVAALAPLGERAAAAGAAGRLRRQPCQLKRRVQLSARRGRVCKLLPR